MSQHWEWGPNLQARFLAVKIPQREVCSPREAHELLCTMLGAELPRDSSVLHSITKYISDEIIIFHGHFFLSVRQALNVSF